MPTPMQISTTGAAQRPAAVTRWPITELRTSA